MPDGQTIHLYTLCWNDARMLPFFFRHYDTLVDRYFMFDNGSTDDTLAILRAHDKVELGHFDVQGDSFVEEERLMSDRMWLNSRGVADWVFVLDLDEHLYRPDLLGYLRQCTDQGITAIKAIGFDMVSDCFPDLDRPLLDGVTRGARSTGFDKMCAFDPNRIESSNFGPGRHTASPEGQVVWPDRSQVLMLHFKQMGVDYPIARSAELLTGLKPGDHANGWGIHYSLKSAAIARVWADIRDAATDVPGLGGRADVRPENYDDEFFIRDSGLVDPGWYHAQYPDVRDAGIDAIEHFCSHGWKEGRRPNFYFDSEWYQQTYPESLDGGNPLLHFLRAPVDDPTRPSVHFDPVWYRATYLGDAEVNPLRHYLQNAASGTVSPRPDFDVEGYCRMYAPDERRLADPYEDYCLRIADDDEVTE